MTQRVYHRGDIVRVIRPAIFVRCGYPLSLDEVRQEVIAGDRKPIAALATAYGLDVDHYPLGNKLITAIAYGLLVKRGFGGFERTLHTEERLNLAGKLMTVTDKRTVKTGTYQPGHDYGDGESDGPHLLHAKTHVILSVRDDMFECLDIEAANVELVPDAPPIW